MRCKYAFLHYDHIGNVILESNSAGAFAAEHEQDAFGRPVLSSAASGWDHDSLHQTTKRWDDAAGLFYFNGQCYDPQIGRFISGEYIYSNNDPIFLASFAHSNRDVNCANDPCEGATVTSSTGKSFGNDEDCNGNCFNFVIKNTKSEHQPTIGTLKTDPRWSTDPQGHIIMYDYSDYWNGRGHASIYDHNATENGGCAASCTTKSTRKPWKVRVHSPECWRPEQPNKNNPLYWPVE